MANGSKGIRAGGAYVELSADDSPLIAALGRAASRLNAFGRSVAGLGLKFVALGSAIVSPLVLASKNAADAGAAIFDMSRRTGIGAEALSTLGFAAKLTGTDMEGLETSIRKMQKTMAGAAMGTKESVDALARLHLTVHELIGLSPDNAFRRIGAAMASIQDPTARAAAAVAVFGKAGTSILPLIEEMGQLEQAARKLGFVKTDEQVRQAKELSRLYQLVGMAIKSAWDAIGTAIFPVMKDVANAVVRALVNVRDFTREHKALVVTVLEAGAALATTGALFLVVGKSLSLLAGAVGGVGFAMRAASGIVTTSLAAMATVISTVFVSTTAIAITGVAAALVGLAGYFLATTQTGQQTLSAMGGYFGALKATATTAIGGITNALAAGEWGVAAAVAWAGVKLAFAQGIQPLEIMLVGAKSAALETWAYLGDGLVEASVRSTSAMMEVWENFKGWFKNLTTDIGDWITGITINIDEALGVVDQAESEARRRNLQQIDQATHANINGERDAALAKNKADADARLKVIKQIHDAEMNRINAKSKAEIQAAQDELDKRRKDLDDLNRKASEDRKNNGDVLPPASSLRSGAGFEPSDINLAKTHAIGGFNPNAIAQMVATVGGGGTADKMLDYERQQYLQLVILNRNVGKLENATFQ